MSKPTLVDFYESLLESLDVKQLEDDGLLTHVDANGRKRKVTVSGRRLALPVRSVLVEAAFDAVIPFHPLCENVAYGRSVVIDALAGYVEHRVNGLGRMLAITAAAVAESPDIQKKIKKTAKYPFLTALADVDERFIENLTTLLSGKAGNLLFDLVLTRNPRNADSRVVRQCLVKCKVLDELDNFKLKDGLLGVKIRKLDVPMLKGLFQYIVGDVESYTGNSITGSSPFFDALLFTYKAIATHLNELYDDLESLVGDMLDGATRIPEGLWMEMDDYAKLRNEVPPLDDSMGVRPRTNTTQAETQQQAAPPTTGSNQQYMTPSQRRRQQAQQQQPQQQNPFMPGAVAFGQPAQQQQQNPFAVALGVAPATGHNQFSTYVAHPQPTFNQNTGGPLI